MPIRTPSLGARSILRGSDVFSKIRKDFDAAGRGAIG